MTSYVFECFEFNGVGWVSRALLELARVEYENVFPEWPASKGKTPFGRLPVLTEVSSDGTKFVLAESNAIELYFADKLEYLPKDSKQRAVATQYYFQATDLLDKFLVCTFHDRTERSRERYFDRIKTFIKKHEPILANSKSGYYCEDSITLADISLYYIYKNHMT
ncbi:hypothetical protein BB560_002647 [Smittium megazygosporum]|uniref:GST N-terminal domain-containing protein n=1 Tax=Smittium megazygosporum TaxID=133381 RepID=A0A2T9ZE75_9FUNG|nr:hypothetical protein BB560_002647 [Smittium megazygosporum]